MTKKAKRQTSKSTAVRPQTAEMNASSSTARISQKEFNPDYTPVIKDLKRIGILAGVFISILVVLSFFLR